MAVTGELTVAGGLNQGNRTSEIGDVSLRLVRRGNAFQGAIFRDMKLLQRLDGDDPDKLWTALHDLAAKARPNFFGYSGAIGRFRRIFPNGFADDEYLSMERAYKTRARDRLLALVPPDRPAQVSNDGAAIASAISTNLLHRVEATRLRSLLIGPDRKPFLTAALEFTNTPSQKSLGKLGDILMQAGLRGWLTASYLPFLWRPDVHMLLKPEVTCEFAERIGHPLSQRYESSLDFSVYEDLLDLTAQTEAEIANLAPRDRIDVQSFIWVVGRYPVETEQNAQPQIG